MIYTILQFLGLSIIALVALQAIYFLIAKLKASNHSENNSSLAFKKNIAQAQRKFKENRNLAKGVWEGFREFYVVNKVDEGGNVYSYYLKPVDGEPMPGFRPGQYLTFSLTIPGQSDPVIRCYSLSDTPARDDYYRLSIKRILPTSTRPNVVPGLVSNYFYEHINEGDTVLAKAPAGNFTIDPYEDAPVVMIAGGIGVTPLLSMLNSIYEAGSDRTVYFFYAVTNSSEHIMKKHLAYIAENRPNIRLHVFYASPLPYDEPSRDYQHIGFVTLAKLKEILPSNNLTFYICGPPPMLAKLHEDLTTWGVPQDEIRYEAFGPASVKALSPVMANPDVSHEITYLLTDYQAKWEPGQGTLLEFSEAHGINMRYGCRSGRCGVCMTKVRCGQVNYVTPPQADVASGNCLPCIAMPTEALELEA